MDIETFRGLVELLTQWEEFPGVTRIELRPVNKHTDELLIPEEEVPRLPLELLGFEAREALDALIAALFIKRMIRGYD